MRALIIIMSFLISVCSLAQTHRGIYKKRDCFCDNHANSSGWNLGIAGYVGKYTFKNDYFSGITPGSGIGVFGANKLNERVAIRLGLYRGTLLPLSVEDEMLRFSLYKSYVFKHWNIPLTLIYRIRSEKRWSPYLAMGGEMNLIRGIEATESDGEAIVSLRDQNGFNQFNLFLGAGSYILFGDHFGMFIQGSVDMNPFINDFSNYNYSFTGKFGLTYHI